MKTDSGPEDIPKLGDLLIVEDDAAFSALLKSALSSSFDDIRCEMTVAGALRSIEEKCPDMLLIDYALPDGSASDVLASCAQLAPAPTAIVMSGTASPQETFRLAQQGVRSFLSKPIDREALLLALAAARASAPSIAPLVRQLVGHRPIREVEREVRSLMLREALARAGESRRGAARLLHVSRQLLQHMLHKAE